MKKVNELQVVVKTKSNYRNLNGVALRVKEIIGDIVAVKVWSDELQKYLTVDFKLKEVVKFI